MNTKKHELLYKELSYEIQGAAIEVRKNFGPGLSLYIKRIIFTNDRKPFLKKLLCLLVFLFVLFRVSPVGAAEIFFDAKTQEVTLGQQFQVDLLFNPQGEVINAISGQVVFPAELLELKSINDGNSIINFWVERPSLNSPSSILYSGVIPGGYDPRISGQGPGLIFSMVFEAKKEGSGVVEVREGKALLHDGKGTEAVLSTKNLELRIQDLGVSPDTLLLPLSQKDSDPPEVFEPQVARYPEMFEGKWFLVFAAQDKASGIDYYAIHESTRIKKRIDPNTWKRAESPYVLEDQGLRSYIYVKAVDKAGNERIAVLEPKYPLRWYEKYENWIIIIIGGLVAIAYIVRKFLWKITH